MRAHTGENRNLGQLQTLSRHAVIKATRSIADIDIGRLGVSNMMPISMIAAPAHCQEKSLADDSSYRISVGMEVELGVQPFSSHVINSWGSRRGIRYLLTLK